MPCLFPLIEPTELTSVTLRPGVPVRLRVVDAKGRPVAGAAVAVRGWIGGRSRARDQGLWLPVGLRTATTGEDGTVVVPCRERERLRVDAVSGSRSGVVLPVSPIAARGETVTVALVAGARVVLAPHTEDMTVERRPPTISAVTDGEGVFTLLDVPVGDSALAIAAPGRATTVRSPVEVPKEGGEVEVGDVVLDPEARLGGRVVGPGDEGVANAFVHVIQQRSWNRLEENQAAKELREPLSTDEDGAFEVGGLAADVPVFVAVAAQGYRQSTLADVEVPRDEPLIIHLEAQVAVDGVVVDSSGRPVEGVRVSAGWRSGSTTSSTSGPITDAEGRFHLESVALGSVTFEASGNGYVTRDPVVVEIVAGETPDPVRIEVVRGDRVSGRVVDATGGPVAGSKASAQWELEGRMASQAIRIDVAADGTFVAEGLPDRRVELIGREDPTSFALDRTDDGGRFEVSSLGPGPAMVLVLDDTGQAIALRGVEIPASDPLVLDLELHAITGRLVIPGTTNAPASTRVTLVPEALGGRLARLGLRTVRSGSDGTFAFDGVSDGPWNLSVDDGTHAPVAIRVVVSGSDVALAAIPLGPLDETAGDDNAPEEGSPPPGRQD